MFKDAVEANDDSQLGAAQARKVDRIIDLAQVPAGGSLVDIGCGYGFLVGQARKRGVAARGLCNSEVMQRKASEAHGPFFDRMDYRELPATASYDAVTAVEMIEAVTAAYLPAFAKAVARALKPGGRAVIQVIHAFAWNNPAGRKKEVDLGSTFVTTHIFPGQQIPHLDWIHEAFHGQGMVLESSEMNGQAYAQTLRAWRHNLDQQAHLFDERMVRKFRYYFAWCQAGFEAGLLHLSRVVFTKPE